MKQCPKCGAEMQDDALFCTKCGESFTPPNVGAQQPNVGAQQPNVGAQQPNVGAQQPNVGAQQPNVGVQQQAYTGGQPYVAPAPQYDPFDHTAEFTAKDISENKVMAMLCYLMGAIGIVIALLGSQSSPYAAFHVRQALKFTVVDILLGIVGLLLCWTFIVPIACGLCAMVLFVVRFICFFSICNGKAKEPVIIRSFGFLR